MVKYIKFIILDIKFSSNKYVCSVMQLLLPSISKSFLIFQNGNFLYISFTQKLITGFSDFTENFMIHFISSFSISITFLFKSFVFCIVALEFTIYILNNCKSMFQKYYTTSCIVKVPYNSVPCYFLWFLVILSSFISSIHII